MTIIDYITSLTGDLPQLSYIKYIVASILVLIVIDAFITTVFGSLLALFRGR